jgi:hypothetical protein
LHSSDDFERGNDRSDRRIALNLQRNEIAYFSIYFMVKIQQALLNSTKRQSFLSEFKSDETLLRDFVVQSLHLHSNKTKRLTHERITSAERVKNQAFYLHPDDIQRLERNVMRAIAGIDIRQTTGVTREDTQTRPYSPGDDTRKINWKVWARTDKFHVNSSPDTTQGISSPIYVILGTLERFSSTKINRPDFYEQHYITALQKEMKRSGREFFVGVLRGDAYFKLHHNSNPRAFLDALYKRHGSDAPHPFRITSKSGPRNSGNFLVISEDFTEIACLHYLASKQPRTSLHYIHTREPEYRVYPLRKDEWVTKGEGFVKED